MENKIKSQGGNLIEPLISMKDQQEIFKVDTESTQIFKNMKIYCNLINKVFNF
jgi:hypothetical protein